MAGSHRPAAQRTKKVFNNDPNFLERFEHGLNTHRLDRSKIPANILGYGEISTIFQINDDDAWAYKRMPLFISEKGAWDYADNYRAYCGYLKQAGIELPEDQIGVVSAAGGLVVLYIVQRQLPAEWFAHNLINDLSADDIAVLLKRLVPHLLQVWGFNRNHLPAVELALDAQLSNWVFENGDVKNGRILYVDTSTPLFRLDGVEQLNPDLILQSAPSFLRWIIRWLFLKDVMERYYDQRQILVDLAANLYKEQRSDLIFDTLAIINNYSDAAIEEITEKDVAAYYREDKLIWTLFLRFRRLDRWLTRNLKRRNYDFILPGKIKR